MTETGERERREGRKKQKEKTHVRDGETKGERKCHDYGERQKTEMQRE